MPRKRPASIATIRSDKKGLTFFTDKKICKPMAKMMMSIVKQFSFEPYKKYKALKIALYGWLIYSTVFTNVPILSIEILISSPLCKVKSLPGTMPVPVIIKQPWGKLLSL
jgi:hypothetical protein